MGLISRQYTYQSGAIILASEQNTNEDALYTLVNGQIDNTNISATAAIVDTKLATIATAGKISGAALTSLTSTPAAAGIIPIANLPKGTGANQLVGCGTAGILPALDGSLLTNIAAATVSSAVLGTGSAGASNFLRGDRTWATVSTGALITSAYGSSGNVTNYTTTSANVLSVSKTITAGNTVFLSAAGWISANSTAASRTYIYLYAGATSAQTIKIETDTTMPNNAAWACSAIVAGLSGATTFTVKAQADQNYTHQAAGNLSILEF
jgi:hypothetical protein